jgi:hypothetical protein
VNRDHRLSNVPSERGTLVWIKTWTNGRPTREEVPLTFLGLFPRTECLRWWHSDFRMEDRWTSIGHFWCHRCNSDVGLWTNGYRVGGVLWLWADHRQGASCSFTGGVISPEKKLSLSDGGAT